MEIPGYMQKGSRGPHVTLLQGFLCGVLRGSVTPKQLVYDQDYGEVTVQMVREFQVDHQLEVDGHWGPKTRGVAREEHNFDFEAACKAIYGTSTFVQSDGSKVTWPRMTGR